MLCPIVVKFDAWMYPSSTIVTSFDEGHFDQRPRIFRGLGMMADFGIGKALGILPAC